MACYHPLRAWRAKEVNSSGKRSLVFKASLAINPDLPLEIPCGKCIGCKLERSRQWAIRCVHEAQLHRWNSFITLTYAEAHLPELGSLVLRDFQLFMKRLRKSCRHRIRFFHCGEYGDLNGRPHYHACLFGHDFLDKYLWSERDGIKLYRSPKLETLWGLGFATIGEVTFESAAYCARYITKKVTGEKADNHYLVYDPETGEIFGHRLPEYCTMSRGGRGKDEENLGGLGSAWYKKFNTDVYPSDEVIIRGRPMRPPRFYDAIYENENPTDFERVKRQRKKAGQLGAADQTPGRLLVRESVHLKKSKLLVRKV